MYNKKIIGKFGEDKVCEYLIKNNYKILQKNFNSYFGEIDIIAQQKQEIIFIEIKTRTQMQFGLPAEAVTNIKQKHMYKTAEYYLYINNLENVITRFDVIEVYKINDENIKINHIKDIINEQMY